MKIAIRLIVCVVVLFGAFAGYWLLLGGDSPTGARGPATRPVVTLKVEQATAQGIGAGSRPWFGQFDDKTGELLYQFRAETFVPQADDTVAVTEPVAEFFLKDGSIIRVRGRSGVVVLPESSRSQSGGSLRPGGMAAPNRGRLKDVVVELLESQTAREPILTATLDNASFDNETVRVTTEPTTNDKGEHVPADEVPVVVRGRDYDFDGRGLLIRMNQRDRELQLLEVAHGGRMVIKNLAAFSSLQRGPAAPGASSTRSPAPIDVSGIALVSADPAAERAALDAAPVASPRQPARYYARLNDAVKVVQMPTTTVTGDVLELVFATSPSQGDGRPSPSEAPASPSDLPQQGSPGATGAEAKPQNADAANGNTAGAEPSAPADEPVVVTWTGPLRLVPLAAADDLGMPAPDEGQMNVRITGEPVHIVQDGSLIRATAVSYLSGDQQVELVGRSDFPVEMTDNSGTVITTPRLVYSDARQVAELIGASSAVIPLSEVEQGIDNVDGNPPVDPEARLVTSWTGQGTIRFRPVGSQSAEADAAQTGADKPARGGTSGARLASSSMAIDRAEFRGGVDVQHPQLSLTSGTLALAFDQSDDDAAGSARQSLKTVEAGDDVKASLRGDLDPASTGDPAATTTLTGEKLFLMMARGEGGEPYPRRLVVDGNVRAADGSQSLEADNLTALLAPSTPHASGKTADRATQLESLDAQGRVKLTGQDGAVVTGDRLEVTQRGEARVAVIRGNPATVKTADSTMTGPVIRVDEASGVAVVEGGGNLEAVQRPPEGGDERPVKVTWAKSVRVDQNADRVDVLGDVVVNTRDADGTITTARSAQLTLNLADPPEGRKGGESTQQAQRSMAARPMGGKQVRDIRLSERVEILSELTGDGGALLRRLFLRSGEVSYETAGRFTVPGEGQLLFFDARPSDDGKAGPGGVGATQEREQQGGGGAPGTSDASGTRAGPAGAINPAGSRGTTAMAWTKSLDYDQSAARVEVMGDVRIVHRPIGSEAAHELTADQVTADLLTQPGQAGNPDAAMQAQLRKVTATGRTTFTSGQYIIQASKMAYDPVGEMLEAQGEDRSPVEVFAADGSSHGAFATVLLNARTGQIKMTDFRGSASSR